MKINLLGVFSFIKSLAKAKEVISGKMTSIEKVEKLIEDVKAFTKYLNILRDDLDNVIEDVKDTTEKLKSIKKEV